MVLLLKDSQKGWLEGVRLLPHQRYLELPIKFKNVRRTLKELFSLETPPASN